MGKSVMQLGAALILTAGILQAQVFNPWVLKKGQPDTRNLKSLTATLYQQAGARTEREKAEAIWRYLLTDGRFVEPGMFYHIAGWAYEEPLGEVLDPLKLLNCYGCGLCYQVAPLLEALWEAGGFPDARVWFVTGHTVTEVYFDGQYHMLDSDMLGYSTVGSGDPRVSPIASVRELENDPQIILGKLLAPNRIDSAKVVFPWYPADVRARAMEGYAEVFSTRADNWLFPFTRYAAGHSMDFVLRPGERLVRLYRPESAGVFYLPYKKKVGRCEEFPRDMPEYNIKTADGPHSQKDSRTWASGRLEYSPRLYRRDSYYPRFGPGFNDNLALPEEENETLGRSSDRLPATAVFEMPCPYVLIDAGFEVEAELTGPAQRLSAATSVDGGKSWQPGDSLSGPFSGTWKTGPAVLAATKNGECSAVSGHYGYLARLTLSGPAPAEGAQIRGVRLFSRFELNPRSLPDLVPGANEMLYSPGPALHKWNVPVVLERLEQFASRVERLKCVEEKDNCLLKPEGWKEGEALFELSAPDGADLVKVHAGGRFLVLDKLAPEKLTAETRETAESGASAARAAASIAWSVSPEGPFAPLWEYAPPVKWLDGSPEQRLLVWPEVDKELTGLPAATKKVYLRYQLEGLALDDIRLAVFTPAGDYPSGLNITHEWISGGRQMSKTVRIDDPALGKAYLVDTGPGKIQNTALILECPAP